MKLSNHCPKCQCARLVVTHMRVEEWVGGAAGTLGPRDRWYEQWSCARCGLVERYRLEAMPTRLDVDRAVETSGGEAPYR